MARRSRLTPGHYTSSAIFDLERDRLFGKYWQFVGFADRLREPKDFITARIAGQEIVVQNFDGELKGFHNVCAHRHSRIHRTAYGNGLLRCPYHGWNYNSDGVPVGIPGNVDYFGLDRAARAQLRLSPVTVECCGDFVFARLAPDGDRLADHLGGFADRLREISETFTDEFAEIHLDWPANWKIAAESTLETYHVNMVHSASLAQVTPDQPIFRTELSGPHSLGSLEMADSVLKWWRKIVRTLKLNRIDRYVGFDHFHIFPNLFIPVSFGSFICLQIYEPIDPGNCRLRYHLRLARATGQQSKEARALISETLADFNRLNLEEDIAITTAVQAGAGDALHPALLGSNEGRLSNFHEAYVRCIER